MENSPKMMLFRSFITVLKRKNLGRMRTSAFIKTTSSRSLTLWFYVAKHVVVAPKCQTFSIHYEYSVYDSRNQWNISDFGLSDAKYSAIRPFLFYGCWMRLNGIFEHVFFLAFNKRCHFPSSCHFFSATRKRRDFVHFWNVSHKWYYKNFCWMCSIASAFMNIEFPSSENQNCFRFFFVGDKFCDTFFQNVSAIQIAIWKRIAE